MVERYIMNKMFEKLPPQTKSVARPSKYSNQFKIIEQGGIYTRVESMHLYEEWLQKKLIDDPMFLEPLRDVKYLACYCKPMSTPCHVDILIKYLEATKQARSK